MPWIEVHILLGSHDIHADIALIATVEGGHREAQHRQGHHELESPYLRTMLTTNAPAKKPVRWKAKKRRERRWTGARQGDTDKGHIERHIGPQGVQLQPVFGARAPFTTKSPVRLPPHQAVDVVPHSVGSHEHDHHEQSQEEEGGPPSAPIRRQNRLASHTRFPAR